MTETKPEPAFVVVDLDQIDLIDEQTEELNPVEESSSKPTLPPKIIIAPEDVVDLDEIDGTVTPIYVPPPIKKIEIQPEDVVDLDDIDGTVTFIPEPKEEPIPEPEEIEETPKSPQRKRSFDMITNGPVPETPEEIARYERIQAMIEK